MRQVKDPPAVRRNIDSSVHTHTHTHILTLTHSHTRPVKHNLHTSTRLNLLLALWLAAESSNDGLEEINKNVVHKWDTQPHRLSGWGTYIAHLVGGTHTLLI